MSLLLVNANTLHIPLADGSVHMALTSPPYWGLRSYFGTGDAQLGLEKLHDCLGWATGAPCGECFICHCRQWAAEIWRVLRDDGTFWLNIGDSYYNYRPGCESQSKQSLNGSDGKVIKYTSKRAERQPGLKEKDACLIPQRLALALQADGWYVRSEIIWAKPNPMPESVTDRPTKSHETVWLLAKAQRYYYDQEAVREEAVYGENRATFLGGTDRLSEANICSGGYAPPDKGIERQSTISRNRRDVWQIATAPYSGAHFATWPPALVEPMIKAGTSERGCCPNCGRQWERVVEHTRLHRDELPKDDVRYRPARYNGAYENINGKGDAGYAENTTLGWRPSCSCPPHADEWEEYPDFDDKDHPTRAELAEHERIRKLRAELLDIYATYDTEPTIVLDPFAGSGTSLLVARQLGRNAIGLDLSYPYLHEQARSRLSLDALDAWVNGKKDGKVITDLPLFAILD